MYQFFVESGQVREKRAYITGSDVNHIRNVLRMHIGERLHLVSPEEARVYTCQITEMSGEQIVCAVEACCASETELPVRITLLQGLPKQDKMELIIQKAVELGVQEIIPLATRNAVVKLDKKKAAGKVTRWSLIAEAAAKQAKRSVLPTVGEVLSFREALEAARKAQVRIMAYELADAKGMELTRRTLEAIKPGMHIALLIGPEGGFTEEEAVLAREAGFALITLGRRILRTETAGMTLLSWLVYLLEK